jgi:twitching motility protein PilT
MSSLINIINNNYSKHIITVEDPIEFVYENKKALIEQREV